jgi:hypothetical protein
VLESARRDGERIAGRASVRPSRVAACHSVCRAQWTAIAYQVVGDGPFDLLLAHGFIMHLDLQWTVKIPLGLWDGSTENKTVTAHLLADLVGPGLAARQAPAHREPIHTTTQQDTPI